MRWTGDRVQGFKGWVVTAMMAGVLLAVGCGVSDDERTTILTSDADEAACEDLLGGDAMRALTGEQDAYRVAEVRELPACQALTYSDVGSRVTVIRVPAHQWSAVNEFSFFWIHDVPGGPPARLLELLTQQQEGAITDDEACELHSALMAHETGVEGAMIPRSDSQGGLGLAVAELCDQGQYALVRMERIGEIEVTLEVADLLAAAVDEIHPADLGG